MRKMKRPLAVVGFTMLTVLSVLCFLQRTALTLVLFATFFLTLFVSLIFKKLRQTVFLPVIFGSAAAACLLLLCFEGFVFLPAEGFCGDRVEITATVEEYPHESSNEKRLYFLSKLVSVNGKAAKGKVRLSFPAHEWKRNTPLLPGETKKLEPGDEVTFVGKLYPIASGNSFFRNYFKSCGFSLSAYPLDRVTVQKIKTGTIKSFLFCERKKAENQILSAFDSDVSGVVVSVLMGSREYVSDEVYSSFSKSGTAHTMAVSGLHLSIWIMFILEILRRRGAASRPVVAFMMLFVLLIMFFASFSGSVKRAGLMMLLYLCSELFSGKADSLNSLGFSAMFVLCLNPYSAVNPSFLLSFLATFSIILFAIPFSELFLQKLKNRFHLKKVPRLLSAVTVSVFISVFAELATLPLQVRCFGGFSSVGVITNLLFLPAFSPAVLCSGLYVMFYFVPLLSKALLFLAQTAVRYCVFAAKLMSSFRYSYISVREGLAWPVFCFIAVLFTLLYFFLRRLKKGRALLRRAA